MRHATITRTKHRIWQLCRRSRASWRTRRRLCPHPRTRRNLCRIRLRPPGRCLRAIAMTCLCRQISGRRIHWRVMRGCWTSRGICVCTLHHRWMNRDLLILQVQGYQRSKFRSGFKNLDRRYHHPRTFQRHCTTRHLLTLQIQGHRGYHFQRGWHQRYHHLLQGCGMG